VPTKKEKQPLSVTHPELAKEADGWDPISITSGSNRKFSWKCPKGHKFEASVANRSKGRNCPYCSNKKILPGFNDLITSHPHLAQEADGWDPSTVSRGSVKKLKWICQNKHNWIAAPNSRTNQNSGCPYCSGKNILVGFNDLATTHPKLAEEAYRWNPKELTSGSRKKRNWICKKNHIWEAPIYSRSAGRGCPVCSNYLTQPGVNDLATLFPRIAQEADGWDPTKVNAGSSKKMKWKCAEGHIWDAVIDTRVRGTDCPFCSGRRAIKGKNDLFTLNPELAKEALDWDPTTLTSKSGQIRKWKCEQGHIWNSTPHNRSKSGCPYCAHKKVLEGFNDLATTHPDLSREADGWNPKTVIAGSHQKLQWKCTNNHVWSAVIKNRAKGIGCPTCATTSFDPNAEGWIYLIENDEWSMTKIGITNKPKNRVSLHLTRGWQLVDLRGPMEGHLAQQWEAAILQLLRAKGADLSNSKIAGKFDGYSEAWSKSTFEVKSIKELMRLTEEFEEGNKTH
jgi:hypothetical protein